MRKIIVAGIIFGLLACIAMLRQESVAAAETASQSTHAIMFPTTFGAGSLIIPMDISLNGQDNGMLRAYGLVYGLLKNGIAVHWAINSTKVADGVDFTASGAGALQDLRTGASIGFSRSYRGGPFIIAPADSAAAMPIILAWQSTVGDSTAVHKMLSGSFDAEIARTLTAAPRIAILKDGFESISFSNLNAAGIPDGAGNAWTSASADALTEAAVAGPSAATGDGALFHSGGLPKYCYMASNHYLATTMTPQVVGETRSWLGDPSTHAFMQCAAATAFENAVSGRFLTSNGIQDDGDPPSPVTNQVPSNPLSQVDGDFSVDGGIPDSIGLAPSSTFKTGVQTLFNNTGSPLIERIVLLTGRLDGSLGSKGKVTYLAGHDYSVTLPISTNPQTNGVRLFLNSIFESDCATESIQDLVVTKSAPAVTNNSQITYTIDYSNPGPRPVENLKLTDRVPAGATYLSGSAIPAPTSVSGGVLTWNLPPLASGASGAVSFIVSVTSDGVYSNAATMEFAHMTVNKVSSNTVTTVVDTIAPTVMIIAGPVGTTNDSTPTFAFVTTGSPVDTQCRFDGVPYVPCSSFFTATPPLVDGPHTFFVRATDAAGNVGAAQSSFTVNTVPVLLSIEVTPTNPVLGTCRSLQFTATGLYSDGSTVDLTASVTWSSSVVAVAIISNASGSKGIATGISTGSPQIRAQLGNVLGSTVLTVTLTDADGDGRSDCIDNCPTTFNPDQRDTNGDGVGDLCTPFQYATGGQFVIGNLVSNTSNVNFWGSQWSQNNPMTGGSAPSAFKGFEDGTALPACGSTWTSRPGNSSNPPATVPTNMAVIVSSSITKSGSTISGNVKKIVVVRTNPGYGPAPGKAGTGKVIAILCEVP